LLGCFSLTEFMVFCWSWSFYIVIKIVTEQLLLLFIWATTKPRQWPGHKSQLPPKTKQDSNNCRKLWLINQIQNQDHFIHRRKWIKTEFQLNGSHTATENYLFSTMGWLSKTLKIQVFFLSSNVRLNIQKWIFIEEKRKLTFLYFFDRKL